MSTEGTTRPGPGPGNPNPDPARAIPAKEANQPPDKRGADSGLLWLGIGLVVIAIVAIVALVTAVQKATSLEKKVTTAQATADKAYGEVVAVGRDLDKEIAARQLAGDELNRAMRGEIVRLDKRADGLSSDLGAEERRTRRLARIIGKPDKGEKRSHEERLAALEGDCDEEPSSEDDSKPAAGALPGAPTADATPPPSAE